MAARGRWWVPIVLVGLSTGGCAWEPGGSGLCGYTWFGGGQATLRLRNTVPDGLDVTWTVPGVSLEDLKAGSESAKPLWGPGLLGTERMNAAMLAWPPESSGSPWVVTRFRFDEFPGACPGGQPGALELDAEMTTQRDGDRHLFILVDVYDEQRRELLRAGSDVHPPNSAEEDFSLDTKTTGKLWVRQAKWLDGTGSCEMHEPMFSDIELEWEFDSSVRLEDPRECEY